MLGLSILYTTSTPPSISEALAVDYTGACLVELLLGDPHGVEGGERGVDGAAEPS